MGPRCLGAITALVALLTVLSATPARSACADRASVEGEVTAFLDDLGRLELELAATHGPRGSRPAMLWP